MLVALTCFLSTAYFANAMNTTNVTTRMAMTLSIVQEHRLDIDRYAPFVLDKAYDGRHYYSDKAPGMSLLAIPAAMFATRVVYPPGTAWLEGRVWTNAFKNVAWLCTITTSGVMVAIGAAALFLLALRLTGDAGSALFATAAYAIGMPTLGWASTLFGHAPSGAMLMTGLCILMRLRRGEALWWPGLAGVCLGMATLIELPAGVAAAIVTIGWFVTRLLDGERPAVGTALAVLGGGVIGLSPLFVYNTLAFGGPLAFGYTYVVGFVGMHSGFFGIGVPDPDVTGEVLFGVYRGLLPVAPIVLAVPFGLWAGWRTGRAMAVICAVAMGWYILVNSGYVYWDGGYAYGPRHLTPMLPFAALPLALLWRGSGAVVRSGLVALLALSTAMAVAAAGFGMVPLFQFENEIRDYLWPSLFLNRFTAITVSPFSYGSMLNALPLVALWAGAFAVFRWLDAPAAHVET